MTRWLIHGSKLLPKESQIQSGSNEPMVGANFRAKTTTTLFCGATSQVDRLQMAHFFRSYDAIPFHFAITLQMTRLAGFGRAELRVRTQAAPEDQHCTRGRHCDTPFLFCARMG
jgi:hypothetical protein